MESQPRYDPLFLNRQEIMGFSAIRTILLKIDRNATKEFVRFSIAGAIVTATDFSIYYFLFHFLSFSVAKGISFICASIFGYLLYKYWTFKHSQPSRGEVWRYTLISILALEVNVITNQSVLNVRTDPVYVALGIATVVTCLVTFIGFKWWVFRTPLKP